MFFYSLNHLLVSLFSVPDYTLVENFIKHRSVCVSLAQWYHEYMFVFLQMIGEGFHEFVFAKNDLPLDFIAIGSSRFLPNVNTKDLTLWVLYGFFWIYLQNWR